jgi:hypothetical protein
MQLKSQYIGHPQTWAERLSFEPNQHESDVQWPQKFATQSKSGSLDTAKVPWREIQSSKSVARHAHFEEVPARRRKSILLYKGKINCHAKKKLKLIK